MEYLLTLVNDPTVWAAFATLVIMEVVLGIDNLIFISILSNKLPVKQRSKARRIGISLALIMRLGLLASIAWIVQLTDPIFSIFGTDFSWKDLILIAGGMFLLWKATKEIHHKMNPEEHDEVMNKSVVGMSFNAAIVQILILDLVFSIDSIITAVGMTEHLPVMIAAVVIAVTVMMISADPLAEFINRHPTIIMLALSFLVMIGMTLIAEGIGHHVPKGYIYTAMAFSGGVELLNMLTKRGSEKRKRKKAS